MISEEHNRGDLASSSMWTAQSGGYEFLLDQQMIILLEYSPSSKQEVPRLWSLELYLKAALLWFCY